MNSTKILLQHFCIEHEICYVEVLQCKQETQRLSSTEEFGRCAFLTMFASICICVLCLYTSIVNSAKQWIAKICVVSTYTFTTSLLQLLKQPKATFPKKQFIFHPNTGHTQQFIAHFLWKTSMMKQKRKTAFWRYTVTFLIVKLWGEKTIPREPQQKMSKW